MVYLRLYVNVQFPIDAAGRGTHHSKGRNPILPPPPTKLVVSIELYSNFWGGLVIDAFKYKSFILESKRNGGVTQ